MLAFLLKESDDDRAPFNYISDFIFVNTEINKADIILIPGGSHPKLAEKAAELFIKGFARYAFDLRVNINDSFLY